MSPESRFDITMSVLRDPAFTEIAHDAVRDHLSWNELAQRPVPDDMDSGQVWELLSAMRRYGSTEFPIPTRSGERFWYTITVEGRHCLRSIERYCRSDSRLHQMVQHRTGHRFLIDALIHESIATCQIDFVEPDPAELERMLHSGLVPESAEGRLVKNTYEMMRGLPSLGKEDFSPELIIHLYERTIRGVDTSRLVRTGAGLRAVPSVFEAMIRARGSERHSRKGHRAGGFDIESLQRICDFANGKTGDPRESVAAKGYMLLAAMGYWRPLPDFNATVARHMLRLLSVRRDFPVLAYLPTSVMMRRWAAGDLGSHRVRFRSIDPGVPTGNGIDGTAEILTHLQLTVAAIDELLRRIHFAKREDEALSKTLRDAARFNYRQRALLTEALRRPESEFTLREHRLKYQTVYSTARADLLELEELGYLRKHTRGQAFVFRASPDLRQKLDRGDGIEPEHPDTDDPGRS